MKRLLFNIAYKFKLKKLAFEISPSLYVLHEFRNIDEVHEDYTPNEIRKLFGLDEIKKVKDDD